MQTQERKQKEKFRPPRWHYALCLGTIPIKRAYQIRRLFKGSPSCNVEFKFRGRGKRPPRERCGNGDRLISYPYKDYLPLASPKLPYKYWPKKVSVYVSIKRSLLKMMEVAKVRDRMLEATRQR